MNLASLADLAVLLKGHPRSSLEIFRSLSRVHQHQLRAGIRPTFPVAKLASMMGLDDGVILRESEVADQEVSRAYRACAHGSRTENRGRRGRPQRYVTEDGRMITY